MRSLEWYTIYFQHFNEMFAGMYLGLINFLAIPKLEKPLKLFVILLISLSTSLLLAYSGFPHHSMGVLGGGYLGPRYFHFLLVLFAFSIPVGFYQLAPRRFIFYLTVGFLLIVQIFGYFNPYYKQLKESSLASWEPVRSILNQSPPGSLVFTNYGTDYLVHLTPGLKKQQTIFARDNFDRRKVINSFPTRNYYYVNEQYALVKLGTPSTYKIHDEGQEVITEAELLSKQRQDPRGRYPDRQVVGVWECRRLDGVDELLLSGTKAEVRHLDFLPPQEIEYHFFNPVANSGDFLYEVVKERGRGEVTIVEQPTPENGGVLVIRIDDGPFNGDDHYRLIVLRAP